MKKVAILCGGGRSSERAVSLCSGRSAYEALKGCCPTELFELDEDRLPESLTPDKYVILPLGHGEFMEDGGLQELLEARHLSYAGSNAAASRLCMDKIATKQIAQQLDIPTPEYILYQGQSFEEIFRFFHQKPFVMKPDNKGSSVGVTKIRHPEDFDVQDFQTGIWFAERCIEGAEITAGLLDGKALPLIKICPKDGFYDYRHKYTSGMTEYLVPAPIDDEMTAQMQRVAEIMFQRCGCRDFARVDFLLDAHGFYFLEINTIPGMTVTSLLPKAAVAQGMTYADLCQRMVEAAIVRDAEYSCVSSKQEEVSIGAY